MSDISIAMETEVVPAVAFSGCRNFRNISEEPRQIAPQIKNIIDSAPNNASVVKSIFCLPLNVKRRLLVRSTMHKII